MAAISRRSNSHFTFNKHLILRVQIKMSDSLLQQPKLKEINKENINRI